MIQSNSTLLHTNKKTPKKNYKKNTSIESQTLFKELQELRNIADIIGSHLNLKNEALVAYFEAMINNSNDQHQLTQKIETLHKLFQEISRITQLSHPLETYIIFDVQNDILRARGRIAQNMLTGEREYKLRLPYWNAKSQYFLNQYKKQRSYAFLSIQKINQELSGLYKNKQKVLKQIQEQQKRNPNVWQEFFSTTQGVHAQTRTKRQRIQSNIDVVSSIQKLYFLDNQITNTISQLKQKDQEINTINLITMLLECEYAINNKYNDEEILKLVFDIFFLFTESEIKDALGLSLQNISHDIKGTHLFSGFKRKTLKQYKDKLTERQQNILENKNNFQREHTQKLIHETFPQYSGEGHEESIKQKTQKDIIDLVITNDESIQTKKDGRTIRNVEIRQNTYICTKQDALGNIIRKYVPYSDKTNIDYYSTEYKISNEEIQNHVVFQKYLIRQIHEHPGSQALQEYVSIFSPIAQEIYSFLEIYNNDKGRNTSALVIHMKNMINTLKDKRKDINPKIENIKNNVKSRISYLNFIQKKYKFGTYTGKLEHSIQSSIQQANKMLQSVEQMEEFFSSIPTNLQEDNLTNWCINNIPKFLGAIGVATLMIMTMGAGSIGLAGGVGLLRNSAVIATGSILGSELGGIGSTRLGRSFYGEQYNNYGSFTKYLVAQISGYDNNIKNRLTHEQEITIESLAKEYGTQRVYSFVMGFAAMGMAQKGVQYLNAFKGKYAETQGIRGNIAKNIQKIQNILSTTQELGTNNTGLNAYIKEFLEEVFEESSGNIVGAGFENIDKKLGFAAGFLTEIIISMRSGIGAKTYKGAKTNGTKTGIEISTTHDNTYGITSHDARFDKKFNLTITQYANTNITLDVLKEIYPGATVQEDAMDNDKFIISKTTNTSLGPRTITIYVIKTNIPFMMRHMREKHKDTRYTFPLWHGVNSETGETILYYDQDYYSGDETVNTIIDLYKKSGAIVIQKEPMEIDYKHDHVYGTREIRRGNESVILTTNRKIRDKVENKIQPEYKERDHNIINAIRPNNIQETEKLLKFYEQQFASRNLSREETIKRNRNYARLCLFLIMQDKMGKYNQQEQKKIASGLYDVFYAHGTGVSSQEKETGKEYYTTRNIYNVYKRHTLGDNNVPIILGKQEMFFLEAYENTQDKITINYIRNGTAIDTNEPRELITREYGKIKYQYDSDQEIFEPRFLLYNQDITHTMYAYHTLIKTIPELKTKSLLTIVIDQQTQKIESIYIKMDNSYFQKFRSLISSSENIQLLTEPYNTDSRSTFLSQHHDSDSDVEVIGNNDGMPGQDSDTETFENNPQTPRNDIYLMRIIDNTLGYEFIIQYSIQKNLYIDKLIKEYKQERAKANYNFSQSEKATFSILASNLLKKDPENENMFIVDINAKNNIENAMKKYGVLKDRQEPTKEQISEIWIAKNLTNNISENTKEILIYISLRLSFSKEQAMFLIKSHICL